MKSESGDRDSKPQPERILCDSRREDEENKSDHPKSDSASIQIINEDSSDSNEGAIKIKQPDPVSEVEKDTPQTAVGLTKTNRNNADKLRFPQVGFDVHYQVKFEEGNQGQKEVVEQEEKPHLEQKQHVCDDDLSECRSPICDYRDVFSTVREQVIAMTSKGEAKIHANLSEETPNTMNQKSTLKKVNKVVLENLTSLLDSLLFQSGLSKQDSQQILSKLFVTHSPGMNTAYNPSKSNQTFQENSHNNALMQPNIPKSPTNTPYRNLNSHNIPIRQKMSNPLVQQKSASPASHNRTMQRQVSQSISMAPGQLHERFDLGFQAKLSKTTLLEQAELSLKQIQDVLQDTKREAQRRIYHLRKIRLERENFYKQIVKAHKETIRGNALGEAHNKWLAMNDKLRDAELSELDTEIKDLRKMPKRTEKQIRKNYESLLMSVHQHISQIKADQQQTQQEFVRQRGSLTDGEVDQAVDLVSLSSISSKVSKRESCASYLMRPVKPNFVVQGTQGKDNSLISKSQVNQSFASGKYEDDDEVSQIRVSDSEISQTKFLKNDFQEKMKEKSQIRHVPENNKNREFTTIFMKQSALDKSKLQAAFMEQRREETALKASEEEVKQADAPSMLKKDSEVLQHLRTDLTCKNEQFQPSATLAEGVDLNTRKSGGQEFSPKIVYMQSLSESQQKSQYVLMQDESCQMCLLDSQTLEIIAVNVRDLQDQIICQAEVLTIESPNFKQEESSQSPLGKEPESQFAVRSQHVSPMKGAVLAEQMLEDEHAQSVSPVKDDVLAEDTLMNCLPIDKSSIDVSALQHALGDDITPGKPIVQKVDSERDQTQYIFVVVQRLSGSRSNRFDASRHLTKYLDIFELPNLNRVGFLELHDKICSIGIVKHEVEDQEFATIVCGLVDEQLAYVQLSRDLPCRISEYVEEKAKELSKQSLIDNDGNPEIPMNFTQRSASGHGRSQGSDQTLIPIMLNDLVKIIQSGTKGGPECRQVFVSRDQQKFICNYSKNRLQVFKRAAEQPDDVAKVTSTVQSLAKTSTLQKRRGWKKMQYEPFRADADLSKGFNGEILAELESNILLLFDHAKNVFQTWNISCNVLIEVQLNGLHGEPFNKESVKINLIKLFHFSEAEQQLDQCEMLAIFNISETQKVAGTKVRNSKQFRTEGEVAEYNVVSKVKVQQKFKPPSSLIKRSPRNRQNSLGACGSSQPEFQQLLTPDVFGQRNKMAQFIEVVPYAETSIASGQDGSASKKKVLLHVSTIADPNGDFAEQMDKYLLQQSDGLTPLLQGSKKPSLQKLASQVSVNEDQCRDQEESHTKMITLEIDLDKDFIQQG